MTTKSRERTVRLSSSFIAGLIVSVSGWSAPGMTDDAPPPAQRADAVRRHELDPKSALESRVRATPRRSSKCSGEPQVPRQRPTP